MRSISLLLIILLGSSALCTHAQWKYQKYPDYKTIVTTFFGMYSVKDDYSYKLGFQKKPDGWHIVVYNERHDSVENDYLFWSLKDGLYDNVGFPSLGKKYPNATLMENFASSNDARWFNLYPYYNYPGWEWDVIQDYKDAKKLPDSILYALGRSYSYFADNLLNSNSGFSDKRFRFKLPDGPDCLNAEQLAQYRKYHDLAIETFKAVKKLNPMYATLVGNISVKLADEYVVAYLDMMVYQDEKEADKELEDNIYDDFMISLAKNYLASCDSNAILFTWGDNDTYPLLYVQAKYKYRCDVLVVNFELLQTTRYIDRMRMPFLCASPLPLSFTKEDFKDGLREYAYIKDRVYDEYQPLDSIINFERSNKNDDKLILSDQMSVNYIPASHFYTTCGKDTVRCHIISTYLLRNQLLLLDIIVNNHWKRPIYFAFGDNLGGLKGLLLYSEETGIACRLGSHKPKPLENGSEDDAVPVDMDVEYNNLMEQFSWKGIEAPVTDEKIVAMSYRYSFTDLARALIQNHKKDSALKVLDRCQELFPDKNLPFDYSEREIMRCYYDLGKNETADAIAEKYIYNLKNNVSGYNGTTSSAYQTNTEQLKDLKLLLKTYNRDKVINQIGD